MRAAEKQQTKLYENHWSKIEELFRGSEWTFDAFARDYVALKTQAIKQEKAGDIYYAFREFFPDLKNSTGGLEEALSDMLRYAKHYAAFSLGRGVTGERARYLARLHRLVEVSSHFGHAACSNAVITSIQLTNHNSSKRSRLSRATFYGGRFRDIKREVIGKSLPRLPIAQATKTH